MPFQRFTSRVTRLARSVSAALPVLAAIAVGACDESLTEPGRAGSPNPGGAAPSVVAGATADDLGTLGGPSSSATSINAAGQVVGASYNASGNLRAFIWTRAAGMRDLGAGISGAYSYAHDINDNGEVVGRYYNGRYRGFIWQQSTGARDLTMPLGAISAAAHSISDNAYIAGSAYLWSSNKSHAVRWLPDGRVEDLGTLPGSTSAVGYGVNKEGHIVGVSYYNSSRRAFLWTPTGGMRDLGTLPGGTSSEAWGINDIGQVVGESTVPGGASHAFLWTEADGMRDLGTLATAPSSRAFAVTESGVVLGTSGAQVVVWTATDGMEQVAGGHARAMNRHWQAVGGSQTASGQTHAFLWTLTPRVTSVAVSPATLDLVTAAPGNAQQLTATLTDAMGNVLADRVVTWSSSDDAVARVDASGLVTAVAPGAATIRATSEGKSGTATAVVKSAAYLLAFHSASTTENTFQVITQRSDGSDRSVLTTHAVDAIGTVPRWSPDGKRIVYQAGSPQGGDIYIMNADGSGSANLTNSPGTLDAGPSFSADGSEIVFTSTRSGSYDLWVMKPDGSGARRLTSHPVEEGTGAYSPDGRLIAYARGSGSGRDIWVMDIESGAEHQVTAIGGHTMYPRWSPDSKKLVFSRDGNIYIVDAAADGATVGSGVSRINPDGSQADMPDWSPDGRKIVWTAADRWDLYMMNPEGTGVERVPTPNGFNEAWATFEAMPSDLPVATVTVTPGRGQLQPRSPGNTLQLKVTMRDRNDRVLVGRAVSWSSSDPSVATVNSSGLVTAAGSGTATITATSEGVSGTATITVSYRIVFQAGDPATGDRQLIVQNTDGSSRHVLTGWRDPNAIGSMAHWAPDGHTIAFNIAQPQWGAIYTVDEAQVNADPATLSRLTDNTALNAGAVFSPDGRKILFLSTRTGRYELWIMDANGANQTRLIESPTEDSPGGFSPDYTQIAFTRGNGAGRDIFVVSFRDNGDLTYTVGTPRQVTAVGGRMSSVRWSPDGTRLVVSREGRLYVVDPTRSNQSLSDLQSIDLRGFPYQVEAPAWSPDGKKIMFTAVNEWELYMVDWSGGVPEKIPTPANRQKNYASFDPIP